MSADQETPAKVAIGISFGNSYSSIAYTPGEGNTQVIANEDGDRQIPSALSYIEGEEFTGNQAKAQLVRNPKNTVAYFRDFLGTEYVWTRSGTVNSQSTERRHKSKDTDTPSLAASSR